MTLKINDLKEIEINYFDVCEEKQILSKQLKEKEKDMELNKISFENLQNALREQQENYDWTITELEKEKLKNEEEIKNYKQSVSNLETEVTSKIQDTSKFDDLEKQNVLLKSEIDKLLIQREAIVKELELVKEELKNQELTKNYLIDRRVINQFLVQYLNHNSSAQIKKQMLETMASILDFTFEEKQVLGILEKSKQEDKQDIGAKFLDFLLEEDDEDN